MAAFEEHLADEKFAAAYYQEALVLDAAEVLWSLLAQEGLSKSDLAARLGKSKSQVTQMLNGGRNLTLRSLAGLAQALGYEIKIEAKKIEARPIVKGKATAHEVPRRRTRPGREAGPRPVEV